MNEHEPAAPDDDLEPTIGSGARHRTLGRRLAAFAVVCVLAVVGAALYVHRAAVRADDASQSSTAHHDAVAGGDKAAPPAVDLTGDLAATLAAPHALVVDTDSGADFERVTAVPLGQPGGRRAATDLVCERVDYAGGHGVCVVNDRESAQRRAVLFDAALHQTGSVSLDGLPSRARVAPNGKTAAVTTFVVGDAYNIDSFSTRTIFIDVDRSRATADLEQFTIERSGRAFHPIDENFWGVTFAPDSDTFFATMRTGGHYYLIRGSVSARHAEVLRDGVECPALSPDGAKIAYKSRIEHGFSPATWQLRVLDVRTLADHPLAETRNVDDQATWLDADHVVYAVADERPGGEDVHTWVVPADGTGSPSPFARYAQSPVIVP
jgi:hypothetical protein